MYDPKYDIANVSPYQEKLGFKSPHTLAIERVREGSKVLDIGCADGYVARELRAKRCQVIGIDQHSPSNEADFTEFVQSDLSLDPLPLDPSLYDYILILDVLEHLRSPESLAASLRRSRPSGDGPTIIASTGNVGFAAVRFMLLFGWFHYGRRGILDLTHTRLFTFSTFRRLFEQNGFIVEEALGVPAPFPLALGDGVLARICLSINNALIHLSKRLFSYQIFMVVRPLPSLGSLLQRAVEASESRAALMAAPVGGDQ